MKKMFDIYSYWTVDDNAPRITDCFVVLSYCVFDADTPALPNKVILDLVYRWWKKMPRASIIVSTGDNQGLGVTNARVMKQYLVRLGIPEKKIIEEGKSKTTYENLLLSRVIVRKKKFKRVTLVTYDLHMKRTLAVAGKQGWLGLTWVSTGGPGGPSFGLKTIQTHSRLTIFLYEQIAWIYNLLRGQR